MSPINGCRPFSLIPRSLALKVLPKKGMQQLYDSLQHILSMHRTSLSRGKSKTIFADPSVKVMYKCLGARVDRASMGVLDYDAWAKKLDTVHWRRVLRMVRRAELLFESFAGDEVLHHIQAAQSAVPYKTMTAPPDPSSPHPQPAKYFGAIAFGCNVFLRCHSDDDFTLSMAHILLDGKNVYNLDDDVVVYFCFPTLGIAIPMRPGVISYCLTLEYLTVSRPDVALPTKLCVYQCFSRQLSSDRTIILLR